jgi:Asp-tRNA(Asn)/Glu-tRNA(Gln) amidotransferase A subunit family amidase
MMRAESENNVWGVKLSSHCRDTILDPSHVGFFPKRTLNPYNRKLTPGGSSGGESALLALRGSPLGVGTVGTHLARPA